MTVLAGEFDRKVQFRRSSSVSDDFSQVDVWADYGTLISANVKSVSDGEKWRAGEVAAHITTRFIIRWSVFAGTLTPKDRLIYEGRVYDISGIKEMVGRRRFLEVTAAARND